jgi:hypothetical protein
MIAMQYQATTRTNVLSLREQLFFARTATAAILTRIVGIYFLNLFASFCRFTNQDGEKTRPSYAQYLLGQYSASQALDVQILDRDLVKLLNQSLGRLVVKMFPRARRLQMRQRNFLTRFAPVLRAFDLAATPALLFGEHGLRLFDKARILDLFAITHLSTHNDNQTSLIESGNDTSNDKEDYVGDHFVAVGDRHALRAGHHGRLARDAESRRNARDHTYFEAA